jgi:hypothetical protein
MNADFAMLADFAARRRSSTLGAGSSDYGSSSGSVWSGIGRVMTGAVSFGLDHYKW